MDNSKYVDLAAPSADYSLTAQILTYLLFFVNKYDGIFFLLRGI